MAKNNTEFSFFDRAMNLADRFFEGVNKFKKLSVKAEKENVEFFDRKIPGFKKAYNDSMQSAANLGSKLEGKVEKALFGKDLYLGAGGEARRAEDEKSKFLQDKAIVPENSMDFSSEIPAKTLPQGWNWISWNDGSGVLRSPEGGQFFYYDCAPYANIGGIEYKEIDGSGWNVFEGSMSDFMSHAESVVNERYLFGISESKKELEEKSLPKNEEFDYADIMHPQNESTEDEVKQDAFFLGEYDIRLLMAQVEENAWYGRSPLTVSLSDGENLVEISGYVYEPGYEFFSATSSISLNGKTLYGKDSQNVGPYHNETYHIGVFEKLEDAIGHIKEVVTAHDFVISDDKKPSLDMQIDSAAAQVCQTKKPDEIKANEKQNGFEH